MSDQTTKEVLERLQRLEDEAAIRETLYAYGAGLDYGDRDQFLECFTADAEYVVTMRVADTTAMRFEGREELTGYFESHTHAPDAWHKHITTNPTCVVNGDRAEVRSYFLRVDSTDDAGPATILASGRYVDTFVRDGDRWRIRSRTCEVENM